ncbi:MAG: hypothetical protein WD399_07570 [Thermoleophilaceae bacterium]
MTLVLSVATPAYAMHVSDRLVSKAGVPYDVLANKTVVVRATDGLLAFGYTGPAFIQGLPTDTWLADVVADGSCAGDLGTVNYGDFPVRDVGATLRRVCQRLRRQREFERLGGEVSAVGWQWDGKRKPGALVRDVLWVLHSGSGKLQWQQLVPRHAPERKRVFRMVCTGDWALTREAWEQLISEVGACSDDWQRARQLLVGAIHRASDEKPGTIGRHCMSVLLRPWRFPNALVEFLPDACHQATAFGQPVETAYSPWMVASDAIHAPAVLVGGLSCEQGLLTYELKAPQVPEAQRLKAAFLSQPRPRS